MGGVLRRTVCSREYARSRDKEAVEVLEDECKVMSGVQGREGQPTDRLPREIRQGPY
jgi:hypothetical protein